MGAFFATNHWPLITQDYKAVQCYMGVGAPPGVVRKRCAIHGQDGDTTKASRAPPSTLIFSEIEGSAAAIRYIHDSEEHEKNMLK